MPWLFLFPFPFPVFFARIFADPYPRTFP